MNKKHKLLHRDNEYITSKLEIIYEEDIQRIVEEKNILQSKIDKANKYLEEHTDKLGKIRIPKIDFNYNELSDILKEVENVENN